MKLIQSERERVKRVPPNVFRVHLDLWTEEFVEDFNNKKQKFLKESQIQEEQKNHYCLSTEHSALSNAKDLSNHNWNDTVAYQMARKETELLL
jgi:hypothetical protein